MSEQEIKTTASHHSTGGRAYHVEVRSNVTAPVMLMGKPYGSNWTRWMPDTCLPVSRIHVVERHHGLLSYEEAMAIAWMAMAYSQGFHENNCFGLAVRVVESIVDYHFTATRKREFEPLPWRGPGHEEARP